MIKLLLKWLRTHILKALKIKVVFNGSKLYLSLVFLGEVVWEVSIPLVPGAAVSRTYDSEIG